MTWRTDGGCEGRYIYDFRIECILISFLSWSMLTQSTFFNNNEKHINVDLVTGILNDCHSVCIEFLLFFEARPQSKLDWLHELLTMSFQ